MTKRRDEEMWEELCPHCGVCGVWILVTGRNAKLERKQRLQCCHCLRGIGPVGPAPEIAGLLRQREIDLQPFKMVPAGFFEVEGQVQP